MSRYLSAPRLVMFVRLYNDAIDVELLINLRMVKLNAADP